MEKLNLEGVTSQRITIKQGFPLYNNFLFFVIILFYQENIKTKTLMDINLLLIIRVVFRDNTICGELIILKISAGITI